MRPADRLMIPLAIGLFVLVVIALGFVLGRGTPADTQAFLVLSGLFAPVVTYVFGSGFIRRVENGNGNGGPR